MGMHFGIVAARTQVAQLMDAFAGAWPHHQPRSRVTLAGLSAMGDWMRATQRQAAATDAGSLDVFGFWQDGQWALMLDPSYAQASDRRALATLSERFGLVLSFVVETSARCAFFEAFDGGRLVRRIQAIDGELQSDGQRLPQEAGLPEDRYDADETRQLQRAFGIAGIEGVPSDVSVVGAAYLDRTDYGTPQRRRTPLPPAPSPSDPPRRAWWRFWTIH